MNPSQKSFHSLHQSAYLFFMYFSYILYIFSLLLYSDKDLRWLSDAVDQFLRIYIGLVLVIKYNPYVKEKGFTAFDRDLVYDAGLFILLTTVITKIVKKYFQYFEADVKASYLYHYFVNDRKLGA